MPLDPMLKPIRHGERVGIELSTRSIILKNDEGKEKTIYPLVYCVWRKCNGNNSIADIIDYCVQRTRKPKEFITNILDDMLEDLKKENFVSY
ncbi:MAG: PqqD family protein [Candidatus Helarchaeales archaeon]